MIIYMRHGDDEQSNPRYRQDPGIRKDFRRKIQKHCRRLLRKYGPPDVVYISPMTRGVETVQEMELPGWTKVEVLPELSRFFLKDEIDFREINPETLQRGLPLFEKSDQFKKRADMIVDWIYRNHKGLNVWCITHALVMKRAALYHRVELPSHQKFLEWFRA